MKTILCIDTISSAAGITLIKGYVGHHVQLNPQMASEGIIRMIDDVITKTKIELSELTGVMVIKGPGSFTGLRVGISVANQFAHQLNIPIVGLRTDEWWLLRSAEPDKLYIQSMNKEEVYVADENGPKIIPIEELVKYGQKNWLGELKFDHQEKLPTDFREISELDSIENTWKKAVNEFSDQLSESNVYELVEPFYGKEPNITKPKTKD